MKHVNKLVIAHLNINSLKTEFEFLTELAEGQVNTLMISEIKIGTG